jgi:hypothetical protein
MLPFSALLLLIPLKAAALFIATQGTLSGTLKPNRVSLVLWSLPPIISFCIAFTSGATLSAIPLLLAGAAPLFILCVSFLSRQSHWKTHTGDYISGLFSIVAIILWLTIQDPALGIVFAIIADLFAALPTITKAWQHPETESAWIYVLGGIGNIIGLLTLRVWNFSTIGFSIYLITLAAIMISSIIHKKLGAFIFNRV